MYAFTLERPTTVADAVKLAAAGAKPLAGGQTLLASMKLRLSRARATGRPGRHQGARRHQQGRQRHRRSAPCRATSTSANNAEVKAAYPALAYLASRIGDRQVRAMGTIGGSVANNDPAACYPERGAGLGRDHRHEQARDRGRRLLPGPVHHRAGRRRADHRHPLPDPEARGLREAAPEGLATSRWSACSSRSTTAACAWRSRARAMACSATRGWRTR